LLEAAISQNARHYDAHIALAKTYFQSVIMDGAYKGKLTARNLNEQERMAAAFRVLDRAIEIDPARADAFALRAGVVSLYAALGFENFKQKLAGVQRLATSRGLQQPATVAWLRTAAAMDLAWARCHALRALPDLKRVLKLKPTDSNAWSEYGRTLMILKREAEARAAFDRALALAPNVSSYSLADTALRRLQSHKRADWYRAFADWSKGPIARMCLSGWRWPPWSKVSRNGKPASYGYPDPPGKSR
jgi:tetratricopeptide (TPR) repeat protein